jgi:uncharacterized protein
MNHQYLIQKKRFHLIWQLLFVLSLLIGTETFAQDDSPGIFYRIVSKAGKDTSYLFGTYHLVNSDYLKELSTVSEAFQKSRSVVVEVLMDSINPKDIQKAGMLQQGSLQELLPVTTADSLDKELKAVVGIGLKEMNQYKPMSITLTLTLMYQMRSNKELLSKYKGTPIDLFFARTGKSNGKKILALETLQEQMDLLYNSLPIEKQVLGLQQFLKYKKEMLSMGDSLIARWMNNDLRGLVGLYKSSLEFSGDSDYLLTPRNIRWMKQLPSMIDEGGYFIAVGALHLGGENGLIQLLRSQGYSVTPLKLKM